MTPCSKYHMVLIKSSKRIRNFVDVTNMHTLFKQLDDEMSPLSVFVHVDIK